MNNMKSIYGIILYVNIMKSIYGIILGNVEDDSQSIPIHDQQSIPTS